MTPEVLAPDEHAVQEHLRGGRFQAGAAAGRWRLVSVEWPFVIVAVGAAERSNGPNAFNLRLECQGYTQVAPTGSLWDTASNISLAAELRPKGERAAQLFRTDGWTGGATAMYAAWDRVGLQSHPGWAQTNPLQAWNPTRDLSFILDNVYEVLNADDYLGV